jgi:hypothetical protein
VDVGALVASLLAQPWLELSVTLDGITVTIGRRS